MNTTTATKPKPSEALLRKQHDLLLAAAELALGMLDTLAKDDPRIGTLTREGRAVVRHAIHTVKTL